MATDSKDTKGGFSPSRLRSSELIGVIGSLVLAGSLFLNWFATDCSAPGTPAGCNNTGGAKFDGAFGSFSAFETFKILDWLLLAACIAPIILAYIVTRGHELSWHPGEVTMIVGMVAFALILLDGIILGRPGGNEKFAVDLNIEFGYVIGLVGAFLLSFGGFRRQAENLKPKPPGV
jgi:hypothetical protein